MLGNLASPAALSSILPIIFLFLATTVILLTAICAAQVTGHPPSPNFNSISSAIASLTASSNPGVGH